MMKIAKSLAMIAFVAAIGVYATSSFFNDVETSENNVFTAGTIDISVDGENPWSNSWTNFLDKPCQVSYMTFTIKNEGENPANVWKKLTNVENGPGDNIYCGASSEPEYEDGGGLFDISGICVGNDYVERDNLSAFMVYDMAICRIPANETETDYCPFITNTSDNPEENKKPDLTGTNGNRWEVLIDENDQVRVDNVVDTWISLTEKLQPGEKLVVSQSYHLMVWDDAEQPMVTNWAQGDTMTFDVELEARQLTAPAPGTTMSDEGDVVATVEFIKQDPTSWAVLSHNGSMTYGVEGATFDYDLDVNGLVGGTKYCLIYYADPYPGNGPSGTAGALLGSYIAETGGTINVTGNVEVGDNLPMMDDDNYSTGAKVWVVPCTSYSTSVVGDPGNVVGWNPASYLFDDGLVNYIDN